LSALSLQLSWLGSSTITADGVCMDGVDGDDSRGDEEEEVLLDAVAAV
jgi:hypothetical protein